MKRSEKKELRQTALLAVCAILLCVALVCASCLIERHYNQPEPFMPVVVENLSSARFILPDGSEYSVLTEQDGVLDAAPNVNVPGYTLVAWRDGKGRDYSPELPAKFNGNVTLTAVLMPALETGQHIAYMPVDGFFFAPDEPLTRLELARSVAALLCVEVEPEEHFVSVSAISDDSYDILKTLGAMDGEFFSPMSRTRLRDLVSVFAAFYPQGRERSLSDIPRDDADYAAFCTAVSRGWLDGGSARALDPDAVVTRGEAAHFINCVLGREAVGQDEDVSGIFADVPPEHPYRDDIMEAAVPHVYRLSEGEEQWTLASAVPRPEPGLFRDGALLRCIGEDGYILKDGEWEGFEFDENGVYTCGMPELDELLQGVLTELGTGEMDDEEALRAVYNYTRDSFTYLRRNYYAKGATGWGEDEAYTMLSTGYGNCYCYAATFYELARALGYDARLISGTVGTDAAPHGWVEISVDGKRHVCDTELEMTYYRDRKPTKPDMFMMPDIISSQWTYRR